MKPTNRSKLELLLIGALVIGIGLACCSEKNNPTGGKDDPEKEASNTPKRLETYSIKGLTFSYYLIPKGLSQTELIAAAKEIHEQEPDAQLLLVDDESGVRDYINYAKGISEGKTDVELPKEWADQHIIANLQKFLSGKWMLYKGNGYEEIGELF